MIKILIFHTFLIYNKTQKILFKYFPNRNYNLHFKLEFRKILYIKKMKKVFILLQIKDIT